MNAKDILDFILQWLPSFGLSILGILCVLAYNFIFLNPAKKDPTQSRMGRQFGVGLVLLIFVILVLLSLPISEGMKGELLNLLGLAITATIALSSTTLVGNSMSGLMLKIIDNIRPGDFLKVGEHMGRVSEQGILHVEIQTEDRDLTTLPNLYLITNPVTVVRSSGTIISTTLSLGYDVSRHRIEKLLIDAATKAELKDAYVQILELGDYSVTYRVAGFLIDPKYLISSRSKLRGQVLDVLHENGVEIVSPTFMNQRVYQSNENFIPKPEKKIKDSDNGKSPEDLIFDKAEQAEDLEKVKEMIKETQEKLKELEKLKDEKTDEEYEAQRAKLQKRLDFFSSFLETKKE
tara:strand:- start:81766 stop:82809 length:1044 start_codon:yes stop_codon:yes gene_type:complete